MDSDITPIFETHNDPPQQPQPMAPEEDNESTPLDELMAPQQPENFPPEPQNSYGPPPPMQNPYYYPQPPPPIAPQVQQPPQWDPFKNISTSTWIILLVAFVLGFFIGKYK